MFVHFAISLLTAKRYGFMTKDTIKKKANLPTVKVLKIVPYRKQNRWKEVIMLHSVKKKNMLVYISTSKKKVMMAFCFHFL